MFLFIVADAKQCVVKLNIGNAASGVQSINGIVNVANTGAGGSTTLNVNDSTNGTVRTAILTTNKIAGLAPADINFTASQVS